MSFFFTSSWICVSKRLVTMAKGALPARKPGRATSFWKFLATSSNDLSTAWTSTSTRMSFLQGASVSTVTFTIRPFS